MLTALTASGRLLLYTPPGNTSSHWRMALDISAHHASLLRTHNTPEPPEGGKKTKTGGKSAAAIVKKPSGHGRKRSQDADETGSVANGNSSEPPRAKRTRLGSKTGLSEEYRVQRLSVACTTCAWLPTLLQVNQEVIGVVAMATRMGHVTLLGVKLPIMLGK